MKLKRREKTELLLSKLRIQHNNLHLHYFGNTPSGIETYFSIEDNLKSFPPHGKLEKTELDFFFYILHNNAVVGFYRVTDLFFNNEIELHGSFNKYNTFLVKTYFELTRLFVTNIQNTFTNSVVNSTVHRENKKAIVFLEYLGFEFAELDKSNDNFLIFKKNQ
jgi:RimJ/RimL family protein N-acetyltransferase